MEGSKETVFQQPPNLPLKRARLDVPWKDEEEEEKWFRHMESVKEWHLTQAVFENTLNSLIEETGSLAQSSIEDEAVRMAIRRHGLTYSENFAYQVERAQIESLLHFPTTSHSSLDSTSRDDLLSQAVSVAICKKGLGTVDR